MFVATFYSYKGGVGRSLALANVAAELAARGKSVLVVDFDLEAPGADSFSFNGYGTDQVARSGIVDFIEFWCVHGKSPDIRDYVYSCPAEGDESTAPIWVMPAGQLNASYGPRLRGIDFSDLYEHHDGYLLVEDMKAQWASSLGVDYVLIDSRTGHTDIGGICTRQLPDMVVFVFWPNAQNLAGLSLIVAELNTGDNNTGRSTERVFVASNLPTLDDEDEILKKHLNKFRSELGYEKSDEVQIKNYPSIDLLDQKLFTTYRPKSRLAKDYKVLADEIQMRNLTDENGVILLLRRLTSRSTTGSTPIPRGAGAIRLNSRAERSIKSLYSSEWANPRINRMLAILKADQAEFNDAISLMDRVIKCREDTLGDHDLIATWLMFSGASADPTVTITRLLDDPAASQRQALSAIRLITKFKLEGDARFSQGLSHRSAIKNMALTDLSRLCAATEDDEAQSLILADLVFRKIVALPGGVSNLTNPDEITLFTLTLISAGYFEFAIDILTHEASLAKESSLCTSCGFNMAMATWGLTGAPSQSLFEEVLRLHAADPKGVERLKQPNYSQCIALANSVVGDLTEAFIHLEHARTAIETYDRSFSCWSYLLCGEFQFIQDLEEQKKWSRFAQIEPRFISRARVRSRDVGHGSLPPR